MAKMSPPDFVILRGGLTVPLPAVRLALELEGRGLRLRVDGDDLLIGPRELITDEDRAALRRGKPHVLALLTYDADAHARVGNEDDVGMVSTQAATRS